LTPSRRGAIRDCGSDLVARHDAHDPPIIRQGERYPSGIIIVCGDHDEGFDVGCLVIVGHGEACIRQRSKLLLVKLHGVTSILEDACGLSVLTAEASLNHVKVVKDR
jgi:hypothetical protein